VKVHVKDYFVERFVTQSRPRININGVRFRSLSTGENDFLCGTFTEQEIVEVVS